MEETAYLDALAASSYRKTETAPRSKFWTKLIPQVNDHHWFISKDGTENHNEQVVLLKLPTDCVGHEGIAHGGFIATLLDESLCYCAYPVLPHRTGVTASLSVNYKSPTPSGTWIMIRAIATSETESRKATISAAIYPESSIKTALESSQLPWQADAPISAEANQVVVEPKWHHRLKHR